MHLGKRSILDGIGLALAGAASRTAPSRGATRSLGCATRQRQHRDRQQLRLPARFAAFANGVAIHADDYDDTQLAVAKDRVYGLLTHPTAPVLPPVLALAERDGRSGRDVLTGLPDRGRGRKQGFRGDASAPLPGGLPHHRDGRRHRRAAAARELLGFDREPTRRALGIAASQAAGLRENFGTMTKPFHAGRAAESGVIAAELAALGFTASPNILEAERGFFRAAGGGYIRRRSTASSATHGRSHSPASRSSRIRAARSRTRAWG